MNVAIVKLSSLGDIVHTMVALQFIKQQRPDVMIDWVVEEKFKAILENNPHINRIHCLNFTKIRQQKSLKLLWQQLKKVRYFGNYDLVIDAQGLLKSAIVAKFLTSKKICGFDRHSIKEKIASYFYSYTINIAYDKNTIDRNIAVICKPLNIEVSAQQIIAKQPFLFSKGKFIIPKRNYIIFIVNSTWENRNYPKERFIQIADKLQKTCLVIWSNDKEQQKAHWMAAKSDYIDKLPKLTLDELKSVISQAQLLIGNDTGPTHIAWGLNVPSITIFGPTPENRVYQTPINKTIKSSSIVNHYKLDKNDDSIKNINSGDIVKLAQQLLC